MWTAAGSSSIVYVYAGWAFTNSAWLTNTYGKSLFVTAYGGANTCGNSNAWDLEVYVNGMYVGGSGSSLAGGGYTTTSFSFLVPAGASYGVTSAPYNCGSGSFNMTAATIG